MLLLLLAGASSGASGDRSQLTQFLLHNAGAGPIGRTSITASVLTLAACSSQPPRCYMLRNTVGRHCGSQLERVRAWCPVHTFSSSSSSVSTVLSYYRVGHSTHKPHTGSRGPPMGKRSNF
uniref:Putative secreted peptide n=1 Tax=Anopheles braziliensis TaxID=58242 RepID=A0A2M3ZSS0_9DIPT